MPTPVRLELAFHVPTACMLSVDFIGAEVKTAAADRHSALGKANNGSR